MASDLTTETGTMIPEPKGLGEETMVREACWGRSTAWPTPSTARSPRSPGQLDLVRKTVRRALPQAQWQPYQRLACEDTRLAAHAD